MSAGQGGRDLPTPGASGVPFPRPQSLALGLGLMAGVAGGLKVAGYRGAAFSLRDDVINLGRWGGPMLSTARLTKVSITL